MAKTLDKNKPYAEIWGGNVPARFEQDGCYYNSAGQQIDLRPEHWNADQTSPTLSAPVAVLGGNDPRVPAGGVTNPPGADLAAGTSQQPFGTRDDTMQSRGTQIAAAPGIDPRATAGGPTLSPEDARKAIDASGTGPGGAMTLASAGPTTGAATGSDDANARAVVAERRSENLLKAFGILEKGQSDLIPELADYDAEQLDAMLEVENRGKKRQKVIDAIGQELMQKRAQESQDTANAGGGDQVSQQLGG